MSLTTLAILLDDLAENNRATIVEGDQTATVSGLSLVDARAVLRECEGFGWKVEIFDSESNAWQADDISEHFQPFRIVISKPGHDETTIALLSQSGFKQWLKGPQNQNRCLLAQIRKTFESHSTRFSTWDDETRFQPVDPTKSPRALVREHSDPRTVPIDIRPWLLKSEEGVDLDDAVFRIWAGAASIALLRALPDEIESESGALKFRGPPRLSLQNPEEEEDILDALGREGFLQLQIAQRWVFENERETEMRHILLAAELAHASGLYMRPGECIRNQISAALDAAKIAYQMSLSDLSRETLKSLADLRKAVTEETAKVTDATRQTIAAVASALVVGIGLIAARLTTNVYPLIIVAIMVVAFAYVLIVALSGTQFIRLQGGLRTDWQPKLYRFLSNTDYENMVTRPIKCAEKTFWWTAGIGLFSVAILLGALIWMHGFGNTNLPANQNAAMPATQPQTSPQPAQGPRPSASPVPGSKPGQSGTTSGAEQP